MSDAGADLGRRRWWRYLVVAVAVGTLILGALTWYVTTNSFQAMVRQRLVAKLEQATGGRVELGSFHTVPFRFRVEVRDLTIHGRELAGEAPYVHVDRAIATVKLISTLGAELGFHSLVLEHPVLHIITYPDGTTNVPKPATNAVQTTAALERLFSLSINRLEIRQGTVVWNQQQIPIDFAANNLFARLDYSLVHRKYNGTVRADNIETQVLDYKPVAWNVDAKIELSRDSLILDSLQAVSGHSRLVASGRLVDFNTPTVAAQYDLSLDLAETGSIVKYPELRRGTLQASGHATWSGIVFSATGTFNGRDVDVDWRTPSLKLKATTLTGQYIVNPQRLAVTDLNAKLLAGELSGEAMVLNWRTPAHSTDHNRGQTGIIHLRAKELSAQAVAEALSSAARPLQRMNLAGAATGSIDASWKGSFRNAESQIKLDVVAPTSTGPKQLPVNAHAVANYRLARGELQLVEFNASTRATQVRASGTLSRQAALNVSLATSDFGEWEYVLAALGYQEQLPVNVHGRASFTGTATGTLADIDFKGRLQSHDLHIMLPAGPHAPTRDSHWDTLTADIELSPHVIIVHNGKLHRADSLMQFDLNADLVGREFTDTSPFRVNLQARNASLADILALSGYHYQATGKVNATLQASGTRALPSGYGSFEISDGTIGSEAVQHVDSKFTFAAKHVSLQDIHLVSGEGQVTGTGSYDFTSGAFHFNLDGHNFDLSRFEIVRASRVVVRGHADFAAQASGTLQQPVVNGDVHLSGLTFDGEPAGDYTLAVETRESELHVSGRSPSQNQALNVEGHVQLLGDWPSNVDVHLNALDFDPLLRAYLDGRVTGHSSATGDVHVQGPLRKPGDLHVQGNIDAFSAELEHVQLRNNDPIRFEASSQTLDIQRFRLLGEGTDLEVGGSIQLAGEQKLDINSEGHADLRLLHSFDPNFNSAGTVAGNLTAGGTIQHPSIRGRLQVTDASVQYGDLPSGLTGLNGSLIFTQDRLQIESLTGHVGGGTVSFAGYANLYNRQLNFDLAMQAQDIRLRYPQGISSMSTAELRWAGTPSGSTLSGDATITKLAITPGFDFSAYLQQNSQTAVLPPTNPLLNSIRLDVHITTTPQLQMQTAALSISGDADLHLRGTAAKPVLLGRIDILEGQIAFNGAKYHLERGDITFSNPVTTTPVLDLRAYTRVREYDIIVNLNGEFDKLNLSYHSEPPLPTADIISLMAPVGSNQEQFGQIQQQTAPSPFVQQASSAVLAEALNSALSNRSQRLFGISHIKIDPQGLNTETAPIQTSPLPAVTIEQPVRENLTLSYTTNLAQTSQQIIQGNYSITSNVSIVGMRDYNGVVSFELRFRQRRK
jgi:translocation and assembly module TamB